uniref:Endonuclease/exonuclease/phosphatase domain-containing protein n=1 Tax=Fagus sylvatica TaxID=28930 RepID=A0A2N9HBX7_FAGSY
MQSHQANQSSMHLPYVQEPNQENPTHNETRNHSGHAREHASPGPRVEEDTNLITGNNLEQHIHNDPTQTNIPLWQPPENSSLRWIWIEKEGWFLTNANVMLADNEGPTPLEATTQLVPFPHEEAPGDNSHGESNHQSNNQHDSSLINRMRRQDFHFETGEPSLSSLECREDEVIQTLVQAATLESGPTALTLTWTHEPSETRMKAGEGKKALSKWDFDDCFEIPRVGLSGGLALGWNLPWEVSIGLHNQNFIQTDIKDQFGNFCSITFIYGHLVLSQRKKIWEELESIANGVYSRWLCIGDFNQVMIDDDKFTFKPCHIPGKLD